MKTFDAIIIGFGKGGKTLATDIAGRGGRVAMVERSAGMYGGSCINVGCIPTKFLIHKASESTGDKREYYREAVNEKNRLIAALREKNYRMLADNPNVEVIDGEGYFLSPDTVGVRTAHGEETISAERIFVDTGSETVIPPINGLNDSRFVYTSTSILDLQELPRRLAIIGGGYIGLEFASMFAAFGSEVTVLEGMPELIPREDRDIAAEVTRIMEKRGIRIVVGANVESVVDTDGYAVVKYAVADGGHAETEAEAVLVSVGRRPAVSSLNLGAAGIETDGRGAIIADEHLRTSNPRVWAIGDVKGGAQFTYISLDDYRIIRDRLFGDGTRTVADREPVQYSVFIDPPLSRIGMSEKEARDAGLDFRVNRIAASTLTRAHTLGITEGVLKALIENGTGRILGCTLLCADSPEVINAVAMAIKTGQDNKFLRDFVFTHPSMGEALNDLFK